MSGSTLALLWKMFGALPAVRIDYPGVQYTIPKNTTEYTVGCEKMEYDIPHNRTEYTLHREDK